MVDLVDLVGVGLSIDDGLVVYIDLVRPGLRMLVNVCRNEDRNAGLGDLEGRSVDLEDPVVDSLDHEDPFVDLSLDLVVDLVLHPSKLVVHPVSPILDHLFQHQH